LNGKIAEEKIRYLQPTIKRKTAPKFYKNHKIPPAQNASRAVFLPKNSEKNFF